MASTNRLARESTLEQVLGAVAGDVAGLPQDGVEVAVPDDAADHLQVAANADRTVAYLELLSGGPVRIGAPGVTEATGWFRLSTDRPGGWFPAAVVGKGAVHAIVEDPGDAAVLLASEVQSSE